MSKGSASEAARGASPWGNGRLLHFIRHGQYHSDPSHLGGLTPLGKRQSRRIGRHFEGIPLDRISSSDLPRAVETADILAAELGMTRPRRYRVLREVLPAAVPGLRVPLLKRAAGKQQIERVLARFFKTSRRPRQEAIVCHANLIRSLVMRLTAGKPDGFHRLVLHHAGITTFLVTENHINVVAFNVLEHLPYALRSDR
jgi:broad specificity phosphatase PhoE